MAAPQTPSDWLPVLAKILDDRYGEDEVASYPAFLKAAGGTPSLRRLRRYARGQADLPEMGQNLKASWERFQQKARTDYGGIAVRSLRNRIKPNGIRIGDSDDNVEVEAARRIWRNNRLDQQMSDAIRDYLECRIGYLVIAQNKDGTAAITREKPEQFIAVTDPLRSWRVLATLKVWRDDMLLIDYAQVMIEGQVQRFARPSISTTGSWTSNSVDGWEPAGEPESRDGDPKVAILDRTEDGAYLEPHLDVIDRINLGKLQRLVTTAMQAFRQRAIIPKEGDGGLPKADEQGHDIDWAKLFEPAPGAMWDIPVAIDIWESQQTDIRPLLEGEKIDARDFAAATGTPISVLLPDGQNQSAEGAAQAKEQQIAQAHDDIARIQPALAAMFKNALAVEGTDLDSRSGKDTVEVLFAPPEHVSLQERYQAAAQAKQIGLAMRTIKRDILGMTPDQIAQDDSDAASSVLMQALAAQSPASGTNNGANAAS